MRLPWVVLAVAACGGRGGVDGGAAGPVASPAPDVAAIERLGGSGFRLVVMNADGSHQRALAPAVSDLFAPVWAADGRSVVYPQGPHFDSASIVKLGSDGNVASLYAIGDMQPICALPDGRFLMSHETGCVGGGFECTTTYEARVLDPATLDSTPLAGVSVRAACSPAGSLAWIGDGGLVVARPTGRTAYRELLVHSEPHQLVWSDDERYVAWTDNTLTGIFELATGRAIRVTSSPCESLQIAGGMLSAICLGSLRQFSLDGVEVGAPIEARWAARAQDGQLAYTTRDALLVARAGKPAVALGRGELSRPAWRTVRRPAPPLAYPDVPDPRRLPRAEVYDDVAVEVAIGLDANHDRVDAAMRDHFAAKIRSQLGRFRACYRPRAAAIPGLAVTMRITMNGRFPGGEFKGYDEKLIDCAMNAAAKLQLGDDPPALFAIDLTFGHPGAPGAVSPALPPPPPPPPVREPPPGPAISFSQVRIAVDTSVSSGALDPEAARRVFLARAGIFRACYQKAVNRKPTIAGTLVIAAAIGADGVVARAARLDGSLHDDEVIACVTSNVKRSKFPPGAAGGARLVLRFDHPP